MKLPLLIAAERPILFMDSSSQLTVWPFRILEQLFRNYTKGFFQTAPLVNLTHIHFLGGASIIMKRERDLSLPVVHIPYIILQSLP